jgi:hypothetical protein
MKSSLLTIAVGLALIPALLRAEGLIYRLPDDGTSARYDLEFKGGADGADLRGKGSFSVSSVGKATVDNEACRWIELKAAVKLNDQDVAVILKVLVPEKHLGKGQSPGEHIVRGWLKFGEGEPIEIKDLKNPAIGPLAGFLAGPLKNEKELANIEVESKLGKESCAGHAGEVDIDQGELQIGASFENRLHDKSPFGVVTCRYKFEIRQGGQAQGMGTVDMKLVDISTTALTELPDKN